MTEKFDDRKFSRGRAIGVTVASKLDSYGPQTETSKLLAIG
jgi:hypothetical protein